MRTRRAVSACPSRSDQQAATESRTRRLANAGELVRRRARTWSAVNAALDQAAAVVAFPSSLDVAGLGGLPSQRRRLNVVARRSNRGNPRVARATHGWTDRATVALNPESRRVAAEPRRDRVAEDVAEAMTESDLDDLVVLRCDPDHSRDGDRDGRAVERDGSVGGAPGVSDSVERFWLLLIAETNGPGSVAAIASSSGATAMSALTAELAASRIEPRHVAVFICDPHAFVESHGDGALTCRVRRARAARVKAHPNEATSGTVRGPQPALSRRDAHCSGVNVRGRPDHRRGRPDPRRPHIYMTDGATRVRDPCSAVVLIERDCEGTARESRGMDMSAAVAIELGQRLGGRFGHPQSASAGCERSRTTACREDAPSARFQVGAAELAAVGAVRSRRFCSPSETEPGTPERPIVRPYRQAAALELDLPGG